MRNPGGCATIFGPDTPTVEIDTFTCGHCNKVVHVKPKCNPSDLGGLCKQCMKMVCPRCVGKGCTPFEERLKQMEEKNRFRCEVMNG